MKTKFIGRVAELHKHEFVIIELKNINAGKKVRVYLNDTDYSLACKCHLFYDRFVTFTGILDNKDIIEVENFKEASDADKTKIKQFFIGTVLGFVSEFAIIQLKESDKTVKIYLNKREQQLAYECYQSGASVSFKGILNFNGTITDISMFRQESAKEHGK